MGSRFVPGIILFVLALVAFLVAHQVPLRDRPRAVCDFFGFVLGVPGVALLLFAAIP